MILRPYQSTAVERVFEEWQDHQSTLAVLPTGTGKTILFSEIIRRTYPRRALVLAHRDLLIWQAVRQLEACGVPATVEMASFTADHRTMHGDVPAVVSTIQTQCAGGNGGRMQHFDPCQFAVVIADECHHYTAPTFRRVLDYYRQNPSLKVCGVTATPDRADEAALGQIFESVAYEYEIREAVRDGWLVRPMQRFHVVESLDFSDIHTTLGDLNGAELARVMEAETPLQKVADATAQIIGNRRTLLFAASIKHAELLAEILNRPKSRLPGIAGVVSERTPKEERRLLVKDFTSGKIQVMCNVGIFSEGVDIPEIEVVVQARPTKSRSLYTQFCGRALRPLPGVVDGLDTPELRRAAIAGSKKPVAEIVDFIGNAGRHKLISLADVLGGKLTDDVIARAKKRAEASPAMMDEELDRAEEDIRREMEERRLREAARRAKLVGRATFRSVVIDPFDAFGLTPPRERGWDTGKVLSEKQRRILVNMGLNPTARSYAANKHIIDHQFFRWREKLASLRQIKVLSDRGIDASNMKAAEASELIDEIARREGWRKR